MDSRLAGGLWWPSPSSVSCGRRLRSTRSVGANGPTGGLRCPSCWTGAPYLLQNLFHRSDSNQTGLLNEAELRKALELYSNSFWSLSLQSMFSRRLDLWPENVWGGGLLSHVLIRHWTFQSFTNTWWPNTLTPHLGHLSFTGIDASDHMTSALMLRYGRFSSSVGVEGFIGLMIRLEKVLGERHSDSDQITFLEFVWNKLPSSSSSELFKTSTAEGFLSFSEVNLPHSDYLFLWKDSNGILIEENEEMIKLPAIWSGPTLIFFFAFLLL